MSYDQRAIELSFGRCCTHPDFWNTFYDIFLESSPRIGPMFVNTDFEKQREIIRNSLNYVLIYAKDENNVIAKTSLNRLARGP